MAGAATVAAVWSADSYRERPRELTGAIRELEKSDAALADDLREFIQRVDDRFDTLNV